MQGHLLQIDENAQQLRTAAWRGFVTYSLAAATLMLVFAISGFALYLYDWWRMSYLYDLNRPFFEQILARDPHLEMMLGCFVAALVYCTASGLMGIRFGKRYLLDKKYSLFRAVTAMAIPSLAAGLAAFAIILGDKDVIMGDSAGLKIPVAIGLMFLVFMLPSIPSGMASAWIARIWLNRDLPPTNSFTNPQQSIEA